MTANNTYSGGTTMSGGNTLFLGASSNGWTTIPAANDPNQGLVIENSNVQMLSFAQQIDPANIVTLNGGSRLTLIGADNTLAGIRFNSNGGTGQPTVTGGTKMTITGDIESTPSNVQVTPLISVALDLNGSDAHDITVAALPQGNHPNNGVNWASLDGLQISSVIQNGGFTKTGDGVLYLTGNNTFTQQLVVAEGVLNVNALNNISTDGRLGNSTLPVILGGLGTTGTLEYSANNDPSTTKAFTLASGGTGAFQMDYATRTMTLNGDVAGGGNLMKTGPGTLRLSTTGTKDYTGDTTVENGTLRIDAAFLASSADVYVSDGAVLQLNFAGTNDVSELYLDAAPQATGTYGASGSGADYESAYFTGSGLLNVTGFTPVAPVAIFTASPTNGAAPLAVTFTDSSTGTITNRYWDFGDGMTTNTLATSVPHTYANAGSYDVQLIVTGQAGSDTNTQVGLIVVGAANPPVPTFAGGAITITGGESVLSFNTEAGYLYGIEYRDSLMDGDWLPLIYDPDYPLPEGWSTSASTGGVMSVMDTNSVNQSLRFYRLRSSNP